MFEEYLEQIFLKKYPQTLDDDIPDKFNWWLESLDSKEIVEHANNYAKLNNK